MFVQRGDVTSADISGVKGSSQLSGWSYLQINLYLSGGNCCNICWDDDHDGRWTGTNMMNSCRLDGQFKLDRNMMVRLITSWLPWSVGRAGTWPSVLCPPSDACSMQCAEDCSDCSTAARVNRHQCHRAGRGVREERERGVRSVHRVWGHTARHTQWPAEK